MAVCDVCSNKISWEDGYVLTTKQVVTEVEYWIYAFTHQWSYTYKMDPKGNTLGMLAVQQNNQSSGWLVCESCSSMFKFNKKKAKKYAKNRNQYPPGSGPADIRETLYAAMIAWKKVFGSDPEPQIMW
ncbi:MAG: hypothetical protein ACTSYD_14455 [Candidatus Heimdallarchaeaceae archaeon]